MDTLDEYQSRHFVEQGKPLSVEDAELEAPRAGEVLVEVKAAGVCQSDLHPVRGDWPHGLRSCLDMRVRESCAK